MSHKHHLMAEYAFKLVGAPYIWGGNGPHFDCSGFVQEVLASVGFDKTGDQTAQMIYSYLRLCGASDKLDTGSIIFYGSDLKNISHVAIALNKEFMIEAAGGDKNTKSISDANLRGAMVRMRPIRNNYLATLYIEV